MATSSMEATTIDVCGLETVEAAMKSTPTVPVRLLTVAGSDSGGGAGIQADLKTFASLQAFGMSAITAITAQNSQGVQAVQAISAELVGQQLDSVLSDLGVEAVKTGMLATQEIVEITAAKLKEYAVDIVVVDPVMISTSGHTLLEAGAVDAYKRRLLPLATVVTPNIKEAEHLLNFTVETIEDMKRAAVELHKLGPKAVLIKGGDKHCESQDKSFASDVFYDGTSHHVLRAARVPDTRNVHGTGCTMAAAIATYLAQDPERNALEAVKSAKSFLTTLLRISKGIPFGKGAQGPMHHAALRP